MLLNGEGQLTAYHLRAWQTHVVIVEGAAERVQRTWDNVVARFLDGDDVLPEQLEAWRAGYQERGQSAVEHGAFPEPYVGRLGGPPAAVVLSLNPGIARLDFQSRHGIFADEIRSLGSYSAWASTFPALLR